MITSAIGLALCYINRIQRRFTFADTVNYRLLVIKASEDSSNQYMNFMNMIFSAEKLVIFNSTIILIRTILIIYFYLECFN
jgi:transcription initiation factor TFIIH subunit 3